MSVKHRVDRIRRMSGRELLWRGRAQLQIEANRVHVRLTGSRWTRRSLASALDARSELTGARRALFDADWRAAHEELSRYFAERRPRFVIDRRFEAAVVGNVRQSWPRAEASAVTQANRIAAGEYDLLGFAGLQFTQPVGQILGRLLPNWHYDPVHGRETPAAFWSTIAYLDAALGDHKIIWELNRHQHWLALGRAYWLTHNEEYRTRALTELASWMAANPPLVGINWASMLELGLRSISWLWALHFFLAPDRRDSSPWMVDLLLGLDRQLTHIERNLSHYFSPNTHLLGEALALYVAGRVIPEFRASGRREAIGRGILVAEASRQIASDGGHCERSTHYHRYALDFYLLAAIVARITSDPVADRFDHTVGLLAAAARALADDTGRLPHIGDDDGGLLLPIVQRRPDDVRDSLAIAGALVDRPDFVIGGMPEESIWMLAHPALHAQSRLAVALAPGARPVAAGSTALAETGYYISRTRTGDHIVIDGGPHGYRNGGHAHADALSVTCSITRLPLLIDPGTGCYTVDATVRDRFRSTASHNTLEMDGRSQATARGPFQWSQRPEVRVHRWRTTEGFDYFEGAHDGYRPVEHRRRVVSLHGELLMVADFVDGSETHQAAVHWHVDPRWTVHVYDRSAILSTSADRIPFVIGQGRIDIFVGDKSSGLGWWSPAYGRVEPTTTIRISRQGVAPFWIVSAFDLNPFDPVIALDLLPVWTEAGSMRHGTAVRLTRNKSSDYLLFAEAALAGTRPSWRVAEFETDASMLLVRVSDTGRVTRLAMVDGSFVRDVGRRSLRVAPGRVVAALHIDESHLRGYPPCAASPGS